jgi:hypothetical protein
MSPTADFWDDGNEYERHVDALRTTLTLALHAALFFSLGCGAGGWNETWCIADIPLRFTW